MDIPKGLVPKDVDNQLEKLLKEPEKPVTLGSILESCHNLVNGLEKVFFFNGVYKLGEEAAGKKEYTLAQVEEVVPQVDIDEETHLNLGFCYSAYINKLIGKDDVITLKPKDRLHGLGSFLKTGTVIIEGSVGQALGYEMSGGLLIVREDTGERLGEDMRGGEIKVYGKLGNISPTCKGTIYHEDKKVWPI